MTGGTAATVAADLVVYTDGACQGNPGPGGWAWAIAPEGLVHGEGGEAHTTNQRMEIMAVLEALRAHEGAPVGSITIVSDSTYVVNCFRDGWWVRWQKNGWKNSKKEPVANPDLWKPLIDLVQRMQPSFRWVKGHSGDRMNDLVDRLAVEAAKGPFDRPRPGSAPGAAASDDGPAQTSLF